MAKTTARSAKHKNNAAKKGHRFINSLLKRGAESSAPEILFISTFVLIRWWNNSDYSYFREIFLPIILFSLLVSAIYYLYRWLLGPGIGAHIAALSLSYLFYIFQFVEGTRIGKFFEGLVPGGLSTPFSRSLVLAAALAVASGAAGWLVLRLYSRIELLRKLQLYKIVLFIIAFVFSLQVVRTAGRLLELKDQLAYDYVSQQLPKPGTSSAKKPDIYYLVLDRYASAATLKANFNYDNSTFAGYLDSQGFTTRPDAYANYPFTMSSIASTLAMDYFPEFEDKFSNGSKWQSAQPYRNILAEPPIAKVLASQGYRYNQISSWWDFTRVGIKADVDPAKSFRLRVLNKKFYLSDLQRDIFFKSILSPWLKKGVTFGSSTAIKYDLDRNPRENFEAQFENLEKIAKRQDKSVPQFSFAHVLAPHPPYVFDANGNQPEYDGEGNDNGADESVKYINEVIYVNKRLEALLASIKQSSEDAVIILQADEGPYPKQFRGPMSASNYYEPQKLPLAQMRQKFSILASYRLPGVPPAKVERINSSVNIFRAVLNEYFGYNLPLLPDCQLSMGNKFNIYSYSLVNEQLGKNSPDECKKYE